MTTAYIVAGPESSGNRLVAAILVRSGCVGEGSTNQPTIDDLSYNGRPLVVIVHHELPIWITRLREIGYSDVKVIVVIREPIANVNSMITRGHVCDHESGHRLRINTIRQSVADAIICNAELHVITYEGITESALVEWLPMIGLRHEIGHLDLIGQDSPNWIENANDKHYAQ